MFWIFRRCSVKKVFLKIPKNSQENTYARISLLIKLQEHMITASVVKELISELNDSYNNFLKRMQKINISNKFSAWDDYSDIP